MGGLNTIDSPYTLKDDETRDCLNVVSTTRGAIRKRTGSTLFTGTPPAVEFTSVFAATISGTRWLLATGGGKIYSINTGGVVTQIGAGFNASAPWSMVQAPVGIGVAGQGPVYMVNGIDPPQYWTGTGEVHAWTGKTEETYYAAGSHVPNGQYMIFAGNRVWMTGLSADPSAVWFSDIVSIGEGGGQGDPTAWPKTNVVRFDSSDGFPITGIGTVGPYLCVFKESKTWIIHDLNTAANRRLADSIGCVSHRSIVETTGGTFFLTADQGVYLTDGSKLHEMSYNVRPTILGLNQARRSQAAGAYFNNHYYLSFPAGASTSNNRTLDYDVQLKSWWLHDLAANQWQAAEPEGTLQLYAAKPGVSSGIIRAFVPGVFTDVGAVYAGNGVLAAYWLGAWQPFSYFIFRHRVKTPFLKKRIRQVHFNGSGVITPIVARDFSTGTEQVPGVPGVVPEINPQLPVNFNSGATIFGNENAEQLFGGTTYQGQTMYFGGASTVQEARLYSLGVARTWSIGFGNNTSDPFEVDSYVYLIQFRKS